MIKYGLISEIDGRTLERAIDILCEETEGGLLSFTEVGVYSGLTSKGMEQYAETKGKSAHCTGIDNNKDGEKILFRYTVFIRGRSDEVYNEISDKGEDLIFIDALHTYPAVISDYYCYRNKVRIGGFLCFHDAAPHAQGKDWQKTGREDDADMYISVLKAIDAVGLPMVKNTIGNGFQLLFHEWDENDRCGGMMVFKRIY